MPRSKNPMRSPACRYFTMVGMELAIWLNGYGPVELSDRESFERTMEQHLMLPDAQQRGLVDRWKWRWSGRFLDTLWMVPGDHWKYHPALGGIRRTFFRAAYRTQLAHHRHHRKRPW